MLKQKVVKKKDKSSNQKQLLAHTQEQSNRVMDEKSKLELQLDQVKEQLEQA